MNILVKLSLWILKKFKEESYSEWKFLFYAPVCEKAGGHKWETKRKFGGKWKKNIVQLREIQEMQVKAETDSTTASILERTYCANCGMTFQYYKLLKTVKKHVK